MGKWLEVYIISWLVFQLLTTKDFTISWIIYGFPTAVVSLKLQWLCLGTPARCFTQALNRGNVLFTTLGKNLARALGSFSSWSFKLIQTHHWEHASVKWDIHSQKYRNTMAVGIYCKIICIQHQGRIDRNLNKKFMTSNVRIERLLQLNMWCEYCVAYTILVCHYTCKYFCTAYNDQKTVLSPLILVWRPDRKNAVAAEHRKKGLRKTGKHTTNRLYVDLWLATDSSTKLAHFKNKLAVLTTECTWLQETEETVVMRD